MALEVQGLKASELEWRFAQRLKHAHKQFRFRVLFLPTGRIPGQEYEVDFVVERIYPTELDGEFAHKSANQKAYDEVRDAILNEFLVPKGYMPIVRIPGYELETDDEMDAVIRELF